MTKISIIGVGGMARALGIRASGAGHDVQIIGRDAAKTAALAAEIGHGAAAGPHGGATTGPLGGVTTGTIGEGVPTGDVVVLAVPYAAAVPIVSGYGSALAGKVVVDITNPFDPAHTGLVTPHDTSAAEQIAAAAPPGAPVVKAFNTLFAGVLEAGEAGGRSADVFIAGDDADANSTVADFVDSLGLRPRQVGGLAFAHWLEGAGLLLLGQAVQREDFSLALTIAR